MQKLKLMSAIVLCFVGLTLSSSCSKEKVKDPDSLNSIVGKWVTSDNNGIHNIHNDTIYFTSDKRVEDYFMFTHTTLYPASAYYFTYATIENSVKITSYQPESAEISETFEYTINGNSLEIKGFSNPFSETNEVRTDVHFTRVK